MMKQIICLCLLAAIAVSGLNSIHSTPLPMPNFTFVGNYSLGLPSGAVPFNGYASTERRYADIDNSVLFTFSSLDNGTKIVSSFNLKTMQTILTSPAQKVGVLGTTFFNGRVAFPVFAKSSSGYEALQEVVILNGSTGETLLSVPASPSLYSAYPVRGNVLAVNDSLYINSPSIQGVIFQINCTDYTVHEPSQAADQHFGSFDLNHPGILISTNEFNPDRFSAAPYTPTKSIVVNDLWRVKNDQITLYQGFDHEYVYFTGQAPTGGGGNFLVFRVEGDSQSKTPVASFPIDSKLTIFSEMQYSAGQRVSLINGVGGGNQLNLTRFNGQKISHQYSHTFADGNALGSYGFGSDKTTVAVWDDRLTVYTWPELNMVAQSSQRDHKVLAMKVVPEYNVVIGLYHDEIQIRFLQNAEILWKAGVPAGGRFNSNSSIVVDLNQKLFVAADNGFAIVYHYTL